MPIHRRRAAFWKALAWAVSSGLLAAAIAYQGGSEPRWVVVAGVVAFLNDLRAYLSPSPLPPQRPRTRRRESRPSSVEKENDERGV